MATYPEFAGGSVVTLSCASTLFSRVVLGTALFGATGCVAEPHTYPETDSGASSAVQATALSVDASSSHAVPESTLTGTAASSMLEAGPPATIDDPSPEPTGDLGVSDDAAAPIVTALPTVSLPLQPSSVCGDGLVESGENCDDGNTSPSDGCSDSCQTEPDFECLVEGMLCTPRVCGDGLLATDEVCDDGNASGGDGCAGDCKKVETDFACLEAGAACVSTVACGNGETDGDEQCDEGESNSNTGDCTLSCTFATCGDGFLQSGEECDDGRLSGVYGGCAAGCILAPRCGDSTIQAGKEQCDEGTAGNTGAYGGCTAECSFAPRCGDKIVQADQAELCDDGDSVEHNGCTQTCKWSSKLSTWYSFNEGSGSVVHDAVDSDVVEVHQGSRYTANLAFDGAFQPGEGAQGGYIHVDQTFGIEDPTRSSSVDPGHFVDLYNLKPNGTAATISVWARRPASSNKQGMLLWMGSDGDGAGGIETTDPFNPHHELFMRAEASSTDLFKMRIGFTASAAQDIDAYEIPKLSSTPEDAVDCTFLAQISYDTWHHYVMVITNLQNPAGAEKIDVVAGLTAYVDGVLLGQENCHSVNLNRFRLAFLGRPEYVTNSINWRGDIDNFMLFSRTLTTQEVIDLYQSQVP